MAKKTQDFEFHDLAGAYRLPDEFELARLAADIEEHGLQEPIVLYEGKVLDGRGRYLACLEAGVEPVFVEWDGEAGSPEAFVASKHTRRDVTKGQHAMALARLYPDGGGGGRGQKDPARNSELSSQFSDRYLQMARGVLRDAPDLADEVTAGTESLRSAYTEAGWRRKMMATLEKKFPDLAQAVEEGEVLLDDALREAGKQSRAHESSAAIVTSTVVREGDDFVRQVEGFITKRGSLVETLRDHCRKWVDEPVRTMDRCDPDDAIEFAKDLIAETDDDV